MESFLLKMIWFSEKRRRLLLLLLEGPKSPEEIKKALGVNWRSLILPLKELKEDELVLNKEGDYHLSVIGKLIAESTRPMDDALNLFEGNTEYWIKRDLSVIPPELRERIGEIREYKVIVPDLNHMFELPEQITSCLRESNPVYSIFSIYNPSYLRIYCELAEKGAQLSLIVTEPVLERVREDYRENKEKIEHLQNADIFLYMTERTGITPPSVVVGNRIFIMSLFDQNQKYDHRDVLSFVKSSISWGKELFEHYRLESEELEFPE
ncbi:MAG: winged helix-turn-helix domain-containing protein [Methanosarcinaceae archaeon]|nr:winged helix-turn-helix domain-containing protein [Methanosarcinaceae archaeon]